MKLNLFIDAEHVEIDDLVWFEEHASLNTTKASELKPFLARFLYEEDGTRMNETKALEQVGHLSIAQLVDATTKLRSFFNQAAEDAVNPPTGDVSS